MVEKFVSKSKVPMVRRYNLTKVRRLVLVIWLFRPMDPLHKSESYMLATQTDSLKQMVTIPIPFLQQRHKYLVK